MNENHQRHLAVTFRYIDSLLEEAGRILGVPAASPFEPHVRDASPAQCRAAKAQVAGLRRTMLRIMAEAGIPAPQPSVSARWAAQGLVGSARIALAEIRPKAMRGYGPLSAEDKAYFESIVAELDAALARFEAVLADEGGGPA